MAGMITFPASSRSRKRSGGLKSKPRRGCRSVAARPEYSVALRPHRRSPVTSRPPRDHRYVLVCVLTHRLPRYEPSIIVRQIWAASAVVCTGHRNRPTERNSCGRRCAPRRRLPPSLRYGTSGCRGRLPVQQRGRPQRLSRDGVVTSPCVWNRTDKPDREIAFVANITAFPPMVKVSG